MLSSSAGTVDRPLREWRMLSREPYRTFVAIAIAGAVFAGANLAAMKIRLPAGGFLPESFVIHTTLLVLSAALILLFSKGRPALFGLTWGAFRFHPRILLWVLPTAILATAQALATPYAHAPRSAFDLSKVQAVLFVWIYASLCEETLVRGLFQTLLRGAAITEQTVQGGVGYRVLLSGLFFGAMHLGLIRLMGGAALAVVGMATLLGFVVAWYRETTGSVLPAMLIHALFNIGGTAPLWLVMWMRR